MSHNPKPKPKTQCTSVLKCSQPQQQLVSVATNPKNSIIFYSTHIQFNGNRIPHDRNSTAYEVHYTADGAYAFVMAREEWAIEVVNLANGDVFVVRGLSEIAGFRVVGVSMQTEEGIKVGQSTRRIYMILQQRGNLCLKVIQMEPKVDNNPKTKVKTIEQNTQGNSTVVKTPLFFSSLKWNLFIICRRQVLRVCRPVNRNNEIQFEFAIQLLEKTLVQLCQNNNILCMSQSIKTWALLCGNAVNSREDTPMFINIFWQHYSGNDLTRNMYYRDDSYIKTVTLPCSEKEFIKMWQSRGFYIIETKSKQSGSHYCHIVSEGQQAGVVSMQVSDNSVVCQQSLSVTGEEIFIFEIVNKMELNKVRLFEAEEGLSTTQATNSTSTTTGNRSQPQSAGQNGPTIKRFQSVPEGTHEQQPESGKSTARKNENPPATGQQVRGLLNPVLMEHLSTKKTQSRNQEAEEELEVPGAIQNVMSFGAPGPLQKKPANNDKPANPELAMTFGTRQLEQKKQQTGPKPPSPQNIKKTSPAVSPKQTKKLISKQRIKQARTQFTRMLKQITLQLAESQESYKTHYEPLWQANYFPLQPLFTVPQMTKLINIEKGIKNYESSLQRRKVQRERNETKFRKVVDKFNKVNQVLEELVAMVGLKMQGSGLLAKINGKTKRQSDGDIRIRKQLSEVQDRMSQIQKNCLQKLSKLKQKLAQPVLTRPTKTSQIFKIIASDPQQPSKRSIPFRVPVLNIIRHQKTKPIIKLSSL